MLSVFYRPAVGYIQRVCVCVLSGCSNVWETRTFGISLSAMSMLILCLFRGGGGGGGWWTRRPVVGGGASVFRSASLMLAFRGVGGSGAGVPVSGCPACCVSALLRWKHYSARGGGLYYILVGHVVIKARDNSVSR